MPSLRARIFNVYLKTAMKSKPLHLVDPAVLRAGTDKIAPRRTPAGVTLEIVSDGAVAGEWHRPENAAPGRTILYFHGGGYVFGSAKSHRGLTFKLAQDARADIFSVDYRLAPEHPFPAAVDDAVAAYQWLLDGGAQSESIIVGGDSAGGGLSLALLLRCKALGLPRPAAAFLYSPFTDLAATGSSLETNEASDVMFKKIYIAEGAKRYIGAADPKDPLVSPLYGDLGGLPPVLTFVSDNEALYDDSKRLHDKLLAAGVDSALIVERGLAHVWPIFYPRFPEAGRTIKQTADFIARRIEAVP